MSLKSKTDGIIWRSIQLISSNNLGWCPAQTDDNTNDPSGRSSASRRLLWTL